MKSLALEDKLNRQEKKKSLQRSWETHRSEIEIWQADELNSGNASYQMPRKQVKTETSCYHLLSVRNICSQSLRRTSSCWGTPQMQISDVYSSRLWSSMNSAYRTGGPGLEGIQERLLHRDLEPWVLVSDTPLNNLCELISLQKKKKRSNFIPLGPQVPQL